MDFIVAKGSVTYAAKTGGGVITGMDQVDLLAPGAIAFINANGGLITTETGVSASIIFDGNYFIVAMGTSQGTVLSAPVYRKHVKYNKTVYVAPAKKVMFLGTNTSGGTTYNLNIPTTKLAGDEVVVEITNRRKPIENTNRVIRVSIVLKGGETSPQIVTAIVNAINSDYRANKVVVATDSDSGHDAIKFEGYDTSSDFSVQGYGLLANADVIAYNEIVYAGTAGVTKGYTTNLTNTVAFTSGTGTDTQMTKVEQDASVYHGNLNPEMFGSYLWSIKSNIVAGETYNQYYITHVAPMVTPLIHENNFDQHLVIVIPLTEYTATGSTTPWTVGGAGAVVDAILAIL